MSILLKVWQEALQSIEQNFRNGDQTDDETKAELRKLFNNEMADMIWSCIIIGRVKL